MYPTQSTNVMPIEKANPNPPRNLMIYFDADTILLLNNANHIRNSVKHIFIL